MMLVALCLGVAVAAKKPVPPAEPPSFPDVAARLLGASLTNPAPMADLERLTDDIGNRISGSPQLDQAISWGVARMKAYHLDSRIEPATIPVWVRGEERASLLSPRARPLAMLGLGHSVGTPKGGIDADVVAVSTFAELDALGDAAKGKIVLYDAPFTDYGATVQYRWGGASAASKHGAVAALVRSVTPVSLGVPHTGSMGYEDGITKIPAAALSIEDATLVARLYRAGKKPRVHLEMDAHEAADAPSNNVVGEWKGREHPEQVVVLGCHLDSWDVGQGAQDDGAGCIAAMHAVAEIAKLPWRPRRTVRVVLFTNEESGGAGGKAYAATHVDEQLVAAMECDTGSGTPFGFDIGVKGLEKGKEADVVADLVKQLAPVQDVLRPIGADKLQAGHTGADIDPAVIPGVLGLGVWQDTTAYWPIHHTDADTFDKVDPVLMNRNVAAMAVMAWYLADSPTPIVPPRASPVTP
jgi:carboxypeptidase Q